MKRMMLSVLFFEILIFSCLWTANIYSQYPANYGYSDVLPDQGKDSVSPDPGKTTILNLNNSISVKKIPVKVIHQSGKTSHELSWKNNKLGIIENIAEGPNGTLYINDSPGNAIIQISGDGNYIKSFREQGTATGGIISKPNQIFNDGNKYIYMSDDFTRRLHKFDINMEYITSVYNPAMFGKVTIGNDGKFYCYPKEKMACPVPIGSSKYNHKILPVKTKYLAEVYDTLGNETGRNGKFLSHDPVVLQGNKWLPYEILAGDNSNFIWFVFTISPVIRKYDYSGNFVEEIKFESKGIDEIVNKKKNNEEKMRKFLEENPEYKNKYNVESGNNNKQDIVVGEVILQNAALLPNGDLAISIMTHGIIQISGNETPSKIVQKIEFVNPDKDLAWYYRMLKIRYINNKLYAYDRKLLIREE